MEVEDKESSSGLAEGKSLGKKILATAVGAVLFLFLIEMGLHAVQALVPEQTDTLFTESSVYKGKPWAMQLYKDGVKFSDLPIQFDRYDEWIRPQMSSVYINIDSEGRRKTWNPEFPDAARAKEVWFLGGSSVFSAGSRDDYTIPSDFSKVVSPGKNAAYRVVNYGRYAYVFPQSVVQFVKLLEEGRRPDYVVFYNGAAEINAAYDSGDGGALLSEALWKSRVETSVLGQAKVVGEEIIRDYCLTCRAVINAVRNYDQSALRVNEIAGMGYDEAKIEALAQDIVKNYLGTLDFVDHLSQTYHFKYMAVWEPSPLGDRLVGDEQKFAADNWRLKDDKTARLFVKTTELLDKRSPPNFYDFSKALRDRTAQMFLDDAHISEEGNQAVAEKIASIFSKQVLSN